MNVHLLWATLFFVTYIVFKIFFTNYEGMYSLMASLMLLAGGTAGIRASAAFGGKNSFTGKIALSFGIALFLVSLSIFSSSLLGILSYGISTILSNVIFISFILAQCISIYALVVSLKMVMLRLETRSALHILVSLVFSFAVGWFNSAVGTQVGLIRTSVDVAFWVYLFPILIFLQLASALLLIDLLGKWYATNMIRVIALGFVAFDVLFPPAMVFVLVNLLGYVGSQVTSLLTGISLQAVTAMYIVTLALTQMKPRHNAPFYSAH